MTQAWYHIVVIGTDLAGLMYAALAARVGYRVAVIGQGGRANTYRSGGFVFTREPERFYGFSTSPAVGRVFSELSLGIEMKNRPRPIQPTLQLVLPDARVDIGGHRRHLERELDRELPGALDPLDAFDAWAAEATHASNDALVADVTHPPTGLRGRAAHRRVVADLADLVDPGAADPIAARLGHPALRALAGGAIAHLAGVRADALSPLCAARLWTHLRAGLFRVPGGLDGLKDVFIRKLREQSSDYRADATASELVLRRGRVVAVRLNDRHEAIGCDLVVGNTDPRQLLALVPRDQRHDAFHTAVATEPTGGWRCVLNLGVRPRVVPEGMGPEALVIGDPNARMSGANCLWVARPGFGKAPGAADARPGPGVLQVSAVLESRGAAPTLTGVQRLTEASLTQLRRVIPWLDDHLEAVDTPAIAIDPATGRPTLDPLELAPLMGRVAPQTLGASALVPTTAYKNILTCGDLLFSGLGFEGACLAALQTLIHTRQRVRIKTSLGGERKILS